MLCTRVSVVGDRRGNTRQLLAFLRAQKRQSKVYNRMKLMVVGLQVGMGRGGDGKEVDEGLQLAAGCCVGHGGHFFDFVQLNTRSMANIHISV